MPNISISYRRSDSQDITGRIFDRLAQRFGRDHVFRDIDNIRPGIDFRTQIASALEKSQVLLVIVGPKWLRRTKGADARISNEADPVRVEVELALKRGIPIIPVLVGGAQMPTTGQLPDSMTDFAFRHAVVVDSGRDFDHHVGGLIHVLEQLLVVDSKEPITAPAPASEMPPSSRGMSRRHYPLRVGIAGIVVLAAVLAVLRPWTRGGTDAAVHLERGAGPNATPTRSVAEPNSPPRDTTAKQGPANATARPDLGRAFYTVRFGLIAPTKGTWSNSYGTKPKAAVELAADLINNPRPELAGFPFTTKAGLPNLSGARIEILTGQLETIFSSGARDKDPAEVVRRLINDDHVAAIAGATTSGLVSATSKVTEQNGIPFVSSESSVNAQLAGDAKWRFRINPAATEIVKSYIRFLTDIRKAGSSVQSMGVICEDCVFFQEELKVLLEQAKQAGIAVSVNVTYSASDSSMSASSDASALARQFKAADPDVVVFLGHMIQFQQFIKAFQASEYHPRIVIVGGTAPSIPSDIFLSGVGSIAQGALIAGVFDPGRSESLAGKINQIFRQKSGTDLDDLSARNMQALFVLAEAVNRAGSAQPEAIRDSLQATDLKPDQLMLGYQGVRFNSNNYNVLGSAFIAQLQGTSYVPVWPPQSARAPFIYPYRGASTAPNRPTAALDAGSGSDTAEGLAGTTWSGTDSTKKKVTFVFWPDHSLRRSAQAEPTGTWKQTGDGVYMEMNNKYAEYEGKIVGNRMEGTARNVNGFTWRWSVEKTLSDDPPATETSSGTVRHRRR